MIRTTSAARASSSSRPARRRAALRRALAGILPLALALAALLCATPAQADGGAFVWPADTDTSVAGMRSVTLYVPGTTGGGTRCVLAATLTAPDDASAANPLPAVIIGHGYGQDRSTVVPWAQFLVRQGYVTLTFDALGFGQSTCQVGLDDPQYDGMVLRSLVDVLGGKPASADTDAATTTPVGAIDFVVHDAVDQKGQRVPYDPRVGTLGVSYGGGMQYALASVDPRIDALVPMETFNDLDYSLFPQAADESSGVQSSTPGVSKTIWGLGLVAAGQVAASSTGLSADPARVLRCQYQRQSTCSDILSGAAQGYPSAALASYLDSISPHASIPKITAPVLLIQGEYDTLFTLNEALASYRQLQAQGNTVRLMWAAVGHNLSSSSDFDPNAPALDQPVNARIVAWFGHWLKHDGSPLGPAFSYTEPWASTLSSGSASDPDAFATATYSLGAGGTLGTSPTPARMQGLLADVAALPTSVGHVDALPLDPSDDVVADATAPGTQAVWQTAPLPKQVDVVGIPKVTLTVSTPLAAWRAQPGNTAAEVTLYLKIYDVAPDGSRGVVGALSTPIRIADTRARVQVNMQGIVHAFAPGHRIALAVAGGDLDFRGGTVPATVWIDAGVAGQTLSLPVAPTS